MNDTMNLLLNRCSVRNFTEDTIPEEIVNNILEAGIRSATGGNLQPISIIKIQNQENAQWFVDLGLQTFIAKAPLNLLFCIDYNRLRKWSELSKAPFVEDKSFRHFWISFQDVIISAQSIETAANSYGLGGVYIGSTIDIIEELKEKFKLPKGVVPVVLLSLGYPKTKRVVSPKLPQSIIVHNEVYAESSDEAIVSAFDEKFGTGNLALTPDRLENVLHIVEEIDGKEQAEIVKKHLEETQEINRAMKFYCFRYPAHFMACDNTRIMKILENDGLEWAGLKNTPTKSEFYSE